MSTAAPAASAKRPSRRSPQRLAEPALYNYALASLARRAQSTTTLRQRLRRRASGPASVDAVLDRLAAAGLLDDRHFALQFASYRAGARRFGRHRIARELRRQGVAEEFIAAALAEVFPATQDEARLARARLERYLRRYAPPYPARVFQKAYRSLLRAGFSSAIILTELRRRRTGPSRTSLEEDAETG